MCGCQNDTAIDMLMYYDARPCGYNGLFDYYTYAPLKGYYAFGMFNELYSLGNACRCTADNKNIYAAAAENGSKSAVMISYYTDDDECKEKCVVELDFKGGSDTYEILLLDDSHNAESIGTVNAGEKLEMQPNTVCLLKSV